MRRNVAILVLFVVAVTTLFYFFVYGPQSEKIEDARGAAEAEENKVQSLRNELRRLEGLKAQAPQLREKIVRLDAAMPTLDPQLAGFILQVQKAADDSGIEWLSVAPSPPAASADPKILDVNISMAVVGGYFQVQDFLVRLETLSRAVKILSVALSPTDLPDLSASFSMRMFTRAGQ